MNIKSSKSLEVTAGPLELARLAYSVAEAAQVTGLGRTTLYGLMACGTLPSRKIGKRRVIRGVDLEALIRSDGAGG